MCFLRSTEVAGLFHPSPHLKSVYYVLVHPHLSCGLACWSNATKTLLKKIIILQNKIVRVMTTVISGLQHQAYTNPSNF